MTEGMTPRNPDSLPSPGIAFEPCRLSLLGFRLFSHPYRGSFQLSLTVLVRYRSWDVFRVGSWFSHVRAELNQRYSGSCLTSSSTSPTGVSPFIPARSSALRRSLGGRKQSKTPHSPNVAARGSVCSVPLSVAPTHGIAVAFSSCGY